MPRRRSIYIDPVRHSAPIPMAAVVGNLLMSSGILGADPSTGELPGDAAQQAEFAFENLQRLMEAAGGSLDDLVHVTVFVKDLDYRPLVNGPWMALFPDEQDRPARHTVKADLPGAMLVQLEVVAFIDPEPCRR